MDFNEVVPRTVDGINTDYRVIVNWLAFVIERDRDCLPAN